VGDRTSSDVGRWDAVVYEPGHRLGPYEVIRVIGEGGAAVVCEVVEPETGEVLALKVLGLRTKQLIARLEREAKILTRLVHPNILEIYGLITVDERPAIRMEYVDGESLGGFMKAHPERDLDTSLHIFRQIVAGMRFAHEQDIIHRDLKPANVLLSTSNEVKVADFGIAKRPDSENTLELTRPEMALGTPSYSAPEQVRDASSVDHRADIFSMGCILFELVCGERAFANRNMMERLMEMAQGEYPDPDALVPSLPPGVVLAIHGSLVADPDGRIPDCRTLQEVLSGALAFEVEGKALRPHPPPGAAGGEGAPQPPEEVTLTEDVTVPEESPPVSEPRASPDGVPVVGVLVAFLFIGGGLALAVGLLILLGIAISSLL
jgi:serine/threonine-protein kinase